jgi:hypothetical protein
MMSPPILTIQYLEDSPELPQVDPNLLANKLRMAAERLPITHLIIGWHLPMLLLEACRSEADRLGMRFIRWQPLLVGDKVFRPDPMWRTVSLEGKKLVGTQNLPEFTFICPNHPAVQEKLSEHLDNLIHQGLYQGFFLDRVRFPSPSADPINNLACFCEYCQHKAAVQGLDLEEIRQEIMRSYQKENGPITLVKALLMGELGAEQTKLSRKISQFLAFRKQSISEFLAIVSQPLRQAHLELGLDCFSPCLTHMVGQDLGGMSKSVDWIKLMTYAHTYAPAGLPFELSGLHHHLTSSTHLSETQALNLMSQLTGLQLPTSSESLVKDGLSTPSLEHEVKRGVGACTVPVLAGLELVKMDGVSYQSPEHICTDLVGMKRANPSGLALSWDLLHIPLEWLDLVRQIYLGSE